MQGLFFGVVVVSDVGGSYDVCVCIVIMCFPAVGVYGVTQEDGTRVSHLPGNQKL